MRVRSPFRPPQARYKFVDDLATVWCEWAEMELRHKNFKRALDIMRRATAAPPRPRTREVRARAVGRQGKVAAWRGGVAPLASLAERCVAPACEASGLLAASPAPC